jgi:hypothetical protein
MALAWLVEFQSSLVSIKPQEMRTSFSSSNTKDVLPITFLCDINEINIFGRYETLIVKNSRREY